MRWLRALDGVRGGPDRYTCRCPMWGCAAPTLVEWTGRGWTFVCAAGCGHDDIVGHLAVDGSHLAAGGTSDWVALMLATGPDMWGRLRDGLPVDRAALDCDWLARLEVAR